MAMVVAEERLSGPHIPLLIDELLQLKIMRDKVDHPRKGSKDLADAVCGSVYNAISRTKIESTDEITVHTYDSLILDNMLNEKEESYNLIVPPKIPADLATAMDRMKIL